MTRFRWTRDSVVEILARASLYRIRATTNVVGGEASGRFGAGAIVPGDDFSGFVEVPIAALRSWNPIQDLMMRRSVEASRYPMLRYDMVRVLGGPERFTVSGTLTFHGLHRDFEAEIRVRIDGDVLRVNGEHTFDVGEFDVVPPRFLNVRVHPEVRVVARLVGVPAA